MSRYIDKDILIDLVNRTSVYVWDTETNISAHEWVLSLIDEIPEADRCSECKGTSDWRTNYCQHCGAKMEKE